MPTELMDIFPLKNETMNVCQRNVARLVHVECRFDKMKDIFQSFGTLVMEALKGSKFGRTYLTGIALDQDMRSLIIDSVQVCRSTMRRGKNDFYQIEKTDAQ